MKIIENFIQQYKKTINDYGLIKDHTHSIIESALKDAGIMAITTSRTKDPDRLQEKLIKRNQESHYASFEDIQLDIPDFIGLRIALYFPNDRAKVKTLIYQLFDVEKEKVFPQEQQQNKVYERRFSGYSASHYRVYLKQPLETALGNQRIEIQVASLLMHAWAEVEHDLTYKQKKGKVSYDEYESLDEINGLVLAGELSLQRLQRISELRIASEGKKFQSHYQLASFLYEKAVTSYKCQNPYLGDVETLFRLFEKKDRLTAKKVENDLTRVDWDASSPVAEQLIDLYATSSIHATQLVFSNKAKKSLTYDSSASNDLKIGEFLRKWVGLEKQLSGLLIRSGHNFRMRDSIHRALLESAILPNFIFEEYNALRIVRNNIVHAMKIPNALDFEKYINQLDELCAAVDSIISSHPLHIVSNDVSVS